jgi:hypothetical protein
VRELLQQPTRIYGARNQTDGTFWRSVEPLTPSSSAFSRVAVRQRERFFDERRFHGIDRDKTGSTKAWKPLRQNPTT